MAVTDKQAKMVLHQEGMTTSTLAPQNTTAHSLFVVLKELHPASGMHNEGHLLVNGDTGLTGKSSVGSGITLSMPLSAMAATNTNNQQWNLPSEATCKGITVTLDNNNMWNEFYRCQTEMILTKQGRRMFPYCRFRISGLEPFQRYTLVMDMHPADHYRYKWSDRRWETNGKADSHFKCSFVHPESPATGLDWMQNPVSFYKLKLTNNVLDEEGHIIINSMHRYLPRLHIIPADKDTDVTLLDGPDVTTFSFPQTEFFAVTAYQNLSITQLKIDYNPFAKGFRDDANSPRACKPKNGLSSETVESEPKLSKEATTINNLKSLFAKRNAAEKVLKGEALSVPTNGDNAVEPEKCVSKKRPWPGGLSELIKGAHVKVKRISLENIQNVSNQHKKTCDLPAGERKLDATSKDCKLENLSGTAVSMVEVEMETEKKPKTLPETTANVAEAEGTVMTSAVSFSKASESSKIKHPTEASSEITAQCDFANKKLDASLNETVDTMLNEGAVLKDEKTNSEEASQPVLKPLDSREVEVKKKRAEPVPLPLLALFLQQLKSKTKLTKPNSKPNTSSLSSSCDKSCNTTAAADILTPAASSTSPPNTPSTAQPLASVASKTIASILSCTDANEIESSCLSLSTTSSSSSLTAPIVTLPDTSVPLSPSHSLEETGTVQTPDPSLIPKHEAASTQDSVSNTVAVSKVNAIPNKLLVSTHQVVPATSSEFTHDPDTNVSPVLPCGASASAPSCAGVQNNELVHSSVITIEPLPDPALDSCTLPCSEILPEALAESPLSADNTDLAFSPSHIPSSPECSMPSPVASSPDPFPPDLFSDRPIPPRKSLDPFSPYISVDKPRPPLDTPKPIPQSFFVTRPKLARGSGAQDEEINCEKIPPALDPDPCTPNATTQSFQEHTSKKTKVKHRKSGKSKINEDIEVTEGPIPVPLQPNLEDVEGQLFVSFMSKKALQIHLGDEANKEVLQETVENVDDKVSCSIEERIEEHEKVLLHDLKIMKHRQVIHPVLQAVGLKLNLLDLTLAIDLQYLGVCLPIPPPTLPGGGSGSSYSSQVLFVSRTGKTTDFTKIKGWRAKFAPSNSSSLTGSSTNSDTGQKNLSAFCSDMLDEYLENEGKLIDERAASFSQAAVSPVAYQLPTKSTSYVRTLDSVLKKQTTPSTNDTIKAFSTPKKSAATSKSKVPGKSREKALKKSSKSGVTKPTCSPNKPSATFNKEGLTGGKNLKKLTKPAKMKTKMRSKTLQASSLPTEKLDVASVSVSPVIQGSTSSSPGSVTTGGRSPGLSKTLVKLMDVEDGAVWEGKYRTYITEERAAIALSSLFTTEGAQRGIPSTIIKRRAPPCLNDFCRLGCVCASLAQERRQHHCGKPQCMLGCNCLRRKVVLLKKSDKDKLQAAEDYSDENETNVKKNKRKKKAYILSGSEATPEPVTHVKALWDQSRESLSDPECLSIPTSARPNCPRLLYPELQQDFDYVLYPSSKKVVKHSESSSMIKDSKGRMTCARVRPFSRRKLMSPVGQRAVKEGHPHPCSQESLQEMEEGELRPPTLSGPSKRLEIVSKCKWATEGSRNVVLRVVCEYMAQDRLKNPFWIGKYRIEPLSRTEEETEEGSTITYKVVISQPHLKESKKEKKESIKDLEAQLIKTIGKSSVKGLPLLSKVAPAGLLKAEKKSPDAQGQITVNGKTYPQAKLELGRMGALHPANRLAAYITGKVRVASQQDTKTVTSATASKTSPTAPTTTCGATTTTTTVTSTNNSGVISAKPTVTNSPVGKMFKQVVISHMNSQQQKLPSTNATRLQSTIKDIIFPTTSLTGATGVSVSPNVPPKASMAFQAPTASRSAVIDSTKAVKTWTVPAVPEKQTVVFRATSPRAAAPVGTASSTQPVTPTRPAVPGQRMVFQMLKTANGNTLYRNPNGRLVQLVPLSQFKAHNPNYIIPKQTTLIRLPAPSSGSQQSKPQTGTHSIIVRPATLATNTTQSQNVIPVHSASPATMTVTSTVVKPVITLSGSKSFVFSGQPSTVKVVQNLQRNNNTSTLRIVPQSVVKVSKTVADPKNIIKISMSSDPSSSNVDNPKGGFILLTPPSCLNTQSEDVQKSDNSLNVSSPSKAGSQQDVQSLQCLKESSEKTILSDHCYSSETEKSTSSENPGNVLKDGSDSYVSASNMPCKEVVDLAPGETDEDVSVIDVVLSTESDDSCKAGSDMEEGEIDSDSTELTEDSDMYDDSKSESSDQEDLFFVTESEGGKKDAKRNSAKTGDLREKDDEELVDIETYEESYDQTQTASGGEDEVLLRRKRNMQERDRRTTLTECFHKLHQTLDKDMYNISKLRILIRAQKEIQFLRKQRLHLMKTEKQLRKKRAYYLQIASQLTGKTKESISQKLDEIIAKQKALEAQHKMRDSSTNFSQQVPRPRPTEFGTNQKNPSSKNKVTTTRSVHLTPNSKPIDLGVPRQSILGSQDKGKENISAKQQTPETNNTENAAVSRPGHPVTTLGVNTLPSSHPTQHLGSYVPISLTSRERTRPNILSRSKSQSLPTSPAKEQVFVPQVIPLLETVVPCSQIITLSNPLRPTGITSLVEGQSATPGVASVSISVPALSHPIRVENPIPILQPQVLKLGDSTVTVNTPGKTVSLPKISTVVSLMSPEKLVVQPPVVLQKVDMPAVIDTQVAFNPLLEKSQQNLSSDLGPPMREGEVIEKQLPESIGKQTQKEAQGSVADGTTSQKEEGKGVANSEPEDENLMSLLDELVFLNQQLSNESSPEHGGASSVTEAGNVPSDLLTEREAEVDRDDERSLSPLFLRLDEDLIASTTSKDDIDDIPPKVDDLVNVIFGSDSPPNSSESEVVTAVNNDGTSAAACDVKRDAPSPPPLMQMKTGGGDISQPLKEQATVSWRPMPKLAPLGLKTQEAGQPKGISTHVLKPGSKPPSLHSANT